MKDKCKRRDPCVSVKSVQLSVDVTDASGSDSFLFSASSFIHISLLYFLLKVDHSVNRRFHHFYTFSVCNYQKSLIKSTESECVRCPVQATVQRINLQVDHPQDRPVFGSGPESDSFHSELNVE